MATRTLKTDARVPAWRSRNEAEPKSCCYKVLIMIRRAGGARALGPRAVAAGAAAGGGALWLVD